MAATGVTLYLAYFLLRDGDRLALQLGSRIPLLLEHKIALSEKFAAVIRATIKGSLIVAMVQGLIGGCVFWILGVEAALLGGVAMGFFSLLPAIGTGLIWVPVAVYLLATGALWQGLVLIFCGLFVIGMVDNVLRPILVGKETRMPDYVVLISTLGGLSLFGINGFVLGPVIGALFMATWDIFGRANAVSDQSVT
jgi:predicted PurR-regulated permease PerM